MAATANFLGFFYFLREVGLKASMSEWLTLMEALVRGYARADLAAFYRLSRALLVKREGQFDLFDQAFATFFKDVDNAFTLDDELASWLDDPVMPRELSDEELAALEAFDLDTLRDMFEERLKEQDERHDGGNKWVGTGGTSPFGHGGNHPAGVRVGGSGGGRSAMQVVGERRFRNLRSDRVLDTRQMGAALRKLRRLARHEGPLELDIDATIDDCAKNGGEIDLIFAPEKKNRVKLLLLMDVGGTMDPHADLCERLFSAAHAATHFKAFKTYYFHNCVYEKLYTDMARFEGKLTADVLKEVDETWTLIVVGDAWMSPYELTHVGGAVTYTHQNKKPGLRYMMDIADRIPKHAWLNPEGERVWHAQSIELIRRVFPMFELTLEGLSDAVEHLRGARQEHPQPGIDALRAALS
ncbi:MAG: VWA domain-containing protein [Deltaproteobacteria bacterium]|nr:VWA domain-containing protein [Deltaproteobacteria bacterium]